MELKERIEKIKEHFLLFNIEGDIAYICVKFPKSWVVADEINDKVSCRRDKKDGRKVFFFSEFDNGHDVLFDAVETVIRDNREIEEKSRLLSEKCKELKELFISESIERLRTIKFVFGKVKKAKEAKPSAIMSKKDAEAIIGAVSGTPEDITESTGTYDAPTQEENVVDGEFESVQEDSKVEITEKDKKMMDSAMMMM